MVRGDLLSWITSWKRPPVKIAKVEDLHCDAGWRDARRSDLFTNNPAPGIKKHFHFRLVAWLFGIGLAIALASSYASCANSYPRGVTTPQGYGFGWKCGCADRACAATVRRQQGVKGAIVQACPGGGSMRPVLLSEIESQATISVAQGVRLDFSDGGANIVTVETSDNPTAVQITSKTNAVAIALGKAHVSVANIGRCPKPTGMQIVLCDPIPTYSVTINVQDQP
jgi:hypothetical protein